MELWYYTLIKFKSGANVKTLQIIFQSITLAPSSMDNTLENNLLKRCKRV